MSDPQFYRSDVGNFASRMRRRDLCIDHRLRQLLLQPRRWHLRLGCREEVTDVRKHPGAAIAAWAIIRSPSLAQAEGIFAVRSLWLARLVFPYCIGSRAA
jgi:hypothetical protein